MRRSYQQQGKATLRSDEVLGLTEKKRSRSNKFDFTTGGLNMQWLSKTGSTVFFQGRYTYNAVIQ